MTVGGSQQLRLFRRARRDGSTIEVAAVLAGMGIAEARLHAADDDRNPPPEEAYELLGTTQSPGTAAPEIAGLQRLHAGRDCSAPSEHPASLAPRNNQQQENDMARGKKKDAPISGEIQKPDYALAVRYYREDIKPAQSKVGEFAQEQSTAYKAIKKNAHIQPAAAKLAFRLDDMEEAKRDDFLRCFNGLLKELKIYMPRDLADIAEGKGTTAENVVPINDGVRPGLATIPMSDGIDADLAGDDDGHLPHAAE